jgi:hypothetical protein
MKLYILIMNTGNYADYMEFTEGVFDSMELAEAAEVEMIEYYQQSGQKHIGSDIEERTLNELHKRFDKQ